MIYKISNPESKAIAKWSWTSLGCSCVYVMVAAASSSDLDMPLTYFPSSTCVEYVLHAFVTPTDTGRRPPNRL